ATVIQPNNNPVFLCRSSHSPAELIVLHSKTQLLTVHGSSNCKHISSNHHLQRVRVADHSNCVDQLWLMLLLLNHGRREALLRPRRLTEDQSLVLSCIPQQEHGHLVGLHLYHRGHQSQTTLLSVAEGTAVRVDPERRPRLHLSGGLNSPRINVSISHLHLSDTGLYMWELSYRQKNNSDQIILGAQKYILLVEGEGV
ncbi:hypothetical protein GOODEAATRI_019218, partial [Goodea atripinnis]